MAGRGSADGAPMTVLCSSCGEFAARGRRCSMKHCARGWRWNWCKSPEFWDRCPPWRSAGASLVGHPGRSSGDHAFADTDPIRPGVQEHEDRRERTAGEPSGLHVGCARGASSKAGRLPSTVRPRLPRRSGSDLCEPGWDATETRLGVRDDLGPLPSIEVAEGRQPSYAAAHAWIASRGIWRRSGNGVRTARACQRQGDCGNLHPRDPGQGRRSGAEMGQLPARELAREA